MATLMLTMAGDTEALGKKWISHFMKRNPCVASLIGKPINSARFRGTQQHPIQKFWERFNTIRVRYNTQ